MKFRRALSVLCLFLEVSTLKKGSMLAELDLELDNTHWLTLKLFFPPIFNKIWNVFPLWMIDFTRKKAPSDSMTYWATCAQQDIQSNGWNKRRSLPTKTYCPGRHSQTVLNKGDKLSTAQRIMKNIKNTIRRLEERPYLRHMHDITPRQLRKKTFL